MTSLIRNLAVLGAFAALTASSLAVTISFQFEGSRSGNGGLTITANAGDIENANDIPVVNANKLVYTYLPGATFTGGTGKLNLVGGTIEFTFDGTNTTTGMAGSILTFANGTGQFKDFGGTGILSHLDLTSDTVGGQFDADIQAVPEPASMMALGMGAAALLRRRARKGA